MHLLQLLPLYTHQTSMVVLQLQCRSFCHMYLLTFASVVHINVAACSPHHSRSCRPVEVVHSGGVVHLLIWDIRKVCSTQGYRGKISGGCHIPQWTLLLIVISPIFSGDTKFPGKVHMTVISRTILGAGKVPGNAILSSKFHLNFLKPYLSGTGDARFLKGCHNPQTSIVCS